MKLLFNETQHDDENYRFGGTLTFQSENIADAAALVDHFKMYSDVTDIDTLNLRIAALQNPDLRHVIGNGKRPVYEVEACLPFEFTAPYKSWAERDLGYDGTFPDLELPLRWGGLIHTNYQSYVRIQGEHICFLSYTTSKPWAGKSAFDYAENRVIDNIGEEFGTRYSEPEFVPRGRNGAMVRNPDYLKRHRATPFDSNATLKRAFFQWWRDNVANDAQLAIIAGNEEIVAGTGDYMSAFKFERHFDTIYYGREDGNYKAMSFTEFAGLV